MTSDKSHSPEHEEKRNSDEEIALEFFDGINELAVVAEGEERVTWFVWALVACSTISGLLFGEPDQPWQTFLYSVTILQAMTLALYPVLWLLSVLT